MGSQTGSWTGRPSGKAGTARSGAPSPSPGCRSPSLGPLTSWCVSCLTPCMDEETGELGRAKHPGQRSAACGQHIPVGTSPPGWGFSLCEAHSCSVAASPGLGHCHLSPAGASSLSACFHSRPHLCGVTLLSGSWSSQSGPRTRQLRTAEPPPHTPPRPMSSRQSACPHPDSPPTTAHPSSPQTHHPRSHVCPSERPASSPIVLSIYPALFFGMPLSASHSGVSSCSLARGQAPGRGSAPGSLLHPVLEQAWHRGGSGSICGASEQRANEVPLVTWAMGGGEGCGHSPSGIRPSRVRTALRSSSRLPRPSDPDPLTPGRWTPIQKTSLGSHG